MDMAFSDGFSSSLYNSVYFIAMTAIPTFVTIKLTNKYMSQKQRNNIKKKIHVLNCLSRTSFN